MAVDARSRWGLPDWTAGCLYPEPDETTDDVWRWEFLRRHPDYRNAWSTWSAVKIEQEGQLEFAPADDDYHAVQTRFGVRAIIDPTRSLTDDVLKSHCVFLGAYGGVSWSYLHGWLMPPQFFVRESGHLMLQPEPGRRRDFDSEGAGLFDFRFDLSRPIEPQLNLARRELAEWQERFFGRKNSPRPRRDNWPLFLRALDARDCLATYAEIASIFWPDMWKVEGSARKTEQSARDTHAQAVRLRDNFPV
jgi:hypothetical protein